jgi:hypothetical protein
MKHVCITHIRFMLRQNLAELGLFECLEKTPHFAT